jgi:outer membrane protein TolC
MGFTTEFASGQVQDSRERLRLLLVAEAEYSAAALRLRLAEEELAEARRLHQVGVSSTSALRTAEGQLRQAQLRIARLQADREEIQAASAPPRDELWAPRVGDRDFVSERLKFEAAGVQDRIGILEERLLDVERGVRAGVATATALADARAQVEDARLDLQMVATRLNLRESFLKEGTSSETIARQLQRAELTSEIQRALRARQVAEERLSLARRQAATGAASALDVARAEVEMMELSLKLRQLELQLQEQRAIKKDGSD